MTEIRDAITSDTVTAHQIPSIPNSRGKRITAPVWKTSALKKEMAADIPPLLSAVKKDDA